MDECVAISAEALRKVFRVYDRRPGLLGSLRDVVDRRYRELVAVDDVDLVVRRAEAVGYIGPNGAGKSTTIKMLTGILEPTSGQVRVNGYDPHRQRQAYVRTVGAVFGQRTQLWWDLAVNESLELLRQLYDVAQDDFDRRMQEFDEVLGLSEFLRTPVRKLSLGQRMKADLAASLVHDPPVLFLDEPTVGVDLVTKEALRSFLRRRNRESGTTIILTTHDMQDIEALCQRVVVIDHGQIMHDGDLEALKRRYGARKRLVLHLNRALTPGEEDTLPGVGTEWTRTSPVELVALFDSAVTSAGALLQAVLPRLEVADVQIEEPSIERVVKDLYAHGGSPSA